MWVRLAFGVLCALPSFIHAGQPRPLTVADGIETARFLSATQFQAQASGDAPGLSSSRTIFTSPDSKRYAALLVRADLERDGNWLEVLSAPLDSFAAASQPRIIARLLMKSVSGGDLTHGPAILPTLFRGTAWLDNERLAFIWGDERNVAQVFAVSLRTGSVQNLTRHPTDVQAFGLNSRGVILYNARAQRSDTESARLLREGFVVKNADFISLASGRADGTGFYDSFYASEYFIIEPGGLVRRKVLVSGRDREPIFSIDTRFSPDGKRAIVMSTAAAAPEEWGRYTSPIVRNALEGFRSGRIDGRTLAQFFVVDIETGQSRALWDAPKTALDVLWSPDSRSVVLFGTVLPVAQADEAGLNGTAAAEVDVRTGRFWQVPLPSDVDARKLSAPAWVDAKSLTVRSGDQILTFNKSGGSWKLGSRSKASASTPAASVTAVRLEVRQDMNTPPALFAIDTASGREQMIFDPNPQLRTDFLLGRVELRNWKDPENRNWTGLLYYPVNYSKEKRYPVVLGTHGHAPASEFSLSGRSGGLGPSSSLYAAQALANRGIAVLQIQDKYQADVPGVRGTAREPKMHMANYEAAVQHLVDAGIADKAKIGLVGYSATGWHVEYALTHSSFPYAAAVVSDSAGPSYFNAAGLGWPEQYTGSNGAPAFGEGLQVWLEESPGFNAEKVHTPLRLHHEGPGLASVQQHWEMFSRLRYLRKPVELYVVPDVEHGLHGVTNPAQIYGSQQGMVDWMDFWLNGHEDAVPEKTEQYARWRELRKLQDQAAAAR